MADGRMLKKKISLNADVANLKNDTHRLLYTWGLAHLDVEGRITGNPRVFRATVVPLLDNISVKDVENFLKDAVEQGLIRCYTVDEGRKVVDEGRKDCQEVDEKCQEVDEKCKKTVYQTFIEYPTFKGNQKLNPSREAPSKIPAPTGKIPVKTKVLGQYGYYGSNWKEAQRKVRERDKVCQLCYQPSSTVKRLSKVVKKSLEVHHIVPFKLMNDIYEANKESNLLALCHACHLRVRANPDLIIDHPIVQRRLVEHSTNTPPEVKLSLSKAKLIKDIASPENGDASPFFSCQFFEVPKAYRNKLATEYPAMTDAHLLREFSKMEDWVSDNRKKKKFKANGNIANPKLFIKNWLEKVTVPPQVQAQPTDMDTYLDFLAERDGVKLCGKA